MADLGTPRKVDAAPARHVKRSNEGGRVVNMESGEGRGKSSVAHDSMRMEAGDSFPGADSDESTRMYVDSMAEAIAKLHPDHQRHKDSVAAKLKAAIQSMC